MKLIRFMRKNVAICLKGMVSTYAGSRAQQAVSLPLRPVIVFLPGVENEGQSRFRVGDGIFEK